MRNSLIAGIAALALVAGAALAGDVTIDTGSRSIRKSVITWDITTNGIVQGVVGGISGELLRLVIPAQLTTNLYTLTLEDADEIDVLHGMGTDISSTIVEAWTGSTTNLPIAIDGLHTLFVTNHVGLGAASVTNGEVVIYWR